MMVDTILCEVIIIICDINTINRAGPRVNLTRLWTRATTDQKKFISIKKKLKKKFFRGNRFGLSTMPPVAPLWVCSPWLQLPTGIWFLSCSSVCSFFFFFWSVLSFFFSSSAVVLLKYDSPVVLYSCTLVLDSLYVMNKWLMQLDYKKLKKVTNVTY